MKQGNGNRKYYDGGSFGERRQLYIMHMNHVQDLARLLNNMGLILKELEQID